MQVGKDVGAICRRCGDVWHVVVAVVGGRVAKVECKQCGARHGFRPSQGAAVGRRSGAGTAPGSRRRSTRSNGALVEADPARAPRAYDVASVYQAGDRILHGRFGEGVVQQATGPGKVVVQFGATQRTLVHGRGAGRA